MHKSLIKILSLLLIVGLNWAGLSAVIETIANFNDTEDSPQNIFVASTLDFSLDSPPDFSPVIMPNATSSRNISLTNDGILGFQYTVTTTNATGTLCNYLDLTANLEGSPVYSGSLIGFNANAGEFSTSTDDWQFTVNLPSDDPALENQTCTFDFVFDGVQIGGAGFYDQEIISNTINSGEWTEPEISGYSPIIDSYISEASPNSNYGDDGELKVRSKNCPNPMENRRAFVQFDFHFPTGTIINSATLKLYMKDAPSEDRTYEARRVLAYWKERDPGPGDGIDWNNQPAVEGVTNSVSSGDTNPKWLEWNVTSDVQGFVDGTYSNYGWRISDGVESSETPYEAKFHSRESNTVDKRPVLEITFTPPEVTTAYPVINEVYYDVASGKGEDPKNEWVEIYNPTDSAVDISGWKICEAGGCDTIPSTTSIPAKGFAVASGKSSTWEDYWTLPDGVITIDLSGDKIGSNGLSDDGDRVILKNASDVVIDAMSYGDDTSQLDPSVPDAEKGNSLARIIKGYDTDSATDWIINATPNPGTNPSIDGVETITFTNQGVEFLGSELAPIDDGISNDLPEEEDFVEEEPILDEQLIIENSGEEFGGDNSLTTEELIEEPVADESATETPATEESSTETPAEQTPVAEEQPAATPEENSSGEATTETTDSGEAVSDEGSADFGAGDTGSTSGATESVDTGVTGESIAQ